MNPPDYRTMPVTSIVGDIIDIAKRNNVGDGFRKRLIGLQKDIFLELPETRACLLAEVGRLVNEYVPPYDPTTPRERFWYEIRDIMQTAFGQK